MRALLVARRQLLGRLVDVELSIRGILRGFGLKVGQVTRKTFEAGIWELVTGQATPMRGLSQPLQEISATAGMRGGAERIRTSNSLSPVTRRSAGFSPR